VRLVLIGGPQDGPLVETVSEHLNAAPAAFVGTLTFGQIAALAHDSRGYIGNDTGLTHLAAAAGARTVMIFGPSDPARYAPFVPEALALWQPVTLSGGVDTGAPADWDWMRDGVTPEDAIPQVLDFLHG
jgi:ADP-heptose:LPS heptosyltransferase